MEPELQRLIRRVAECDRRRAALAQQRTEVNKAWEASGEDCATAAKALEAYVSDLIKMEAPQ